MRSCQIKSQLILGILCLGYLSHVVDTVTIEKFLTLTYAEKVILDKLKDRIATKVTHEYMKQDAYLIMWVRGEIYTES